MRKLSRHFFCAALLLVGASSAAQRSENIAGIEARARAGDARAMVELGNFYLQGSGVSQNYADAARWYRAAADKGDAEGMRRLGDLYYGGKGVSQDYVEALRWFRSAAAGGNARAAWQVGMVHVSGNGAAKDYAEAVRWFRQAAAKGNAEGLNSLGVMYSLGNGVAKNKLEALRYFERAADQGAASALLNMSGIYKAGEGIPANLVAADGLKAAWDRSADPRQWRTYMTQAQPLQTVSIVPRQAEPRRTPPDWIDVEGNEPGEVRQYDRAHVLVSRKYPGARDFEGQPIGDSIQIVFRDGSSLNLDCANSKYSMWDTRANENWGGAMSSMALASRFGAQYCPVIGQLKCRPTFSSGDPPCANQDY